jgi:hypothetical protein
MLDRRTVSMTRMLMTISKPFRALAATIAAALLLSGIASAAVAGVVTAVTKRDITVSGATYALADGVEVEDMTGRPISLPEVRPGVSVELEFDDAGRLTVIRAAVVR